jgi:hypothetical protein
MIRSRQTVSYSKIGPSSFLIISYITLNFLGSPREGTPLPTIVIACHLSFWAKL